MSKSNTQILILPGESGWETWARSGEGAFELQHATELHHPGELVDIPAGELTMLFALRSITTVPMRVMTTKEDMFADLAGLHAERLGLRADPLAGQLNDVFEIAREEQSTVLLSVWLKPPGEGDLPVVGPKAFDFSARVTPLDGSAAALWRELGRWVFAIHEGGKLLYAQATACAADRPDAAVARELKLALMQLSMQGLEPKPNRIVVWSSDAATDLGALRDAFELPVEIHPRPAPVLPDPISRLLPEDVRAARKQAQRTQRIRMAVGSVAAMYLLFAAWLIFGLWQDGRQLAKLETQAQLAAPENAAYQSHADRWRALADAIDIDHSPVEILHRIAGCIPPNSGLRLTSAEISPYEIRLTGEAPSNEAANQFRLKLRKNTSLGRYDWSNLPDSTPGKLGRVFKYAVSEKLEEQAP